jgi:signal transduction histidine kinase
LIHGIVHDITSLRNAENSKIQIEKFTANERLIRIMAHEIRNPLNNIRLAADYLQSMDKESQEELYLEIIKRNTNRINQLISELLDFSKPVELVSQEISLQHVVEKSLSETMDRMQLKKIQLIKEYTDDSFNIIADIQNFQ